MPCAETMPALSIKIAAVVDIRRRVLMDVSCRHSAICFNFGDVWTDNVGQAAIVPNTH
jgi:hypothetical protein